MNSEARKFELREPAPSEFIFETMLIRKFASEPNPYISEREGTAFGEKYWFSQAQSGTLAGFGRGVTRRQSLVKAVSEYYERRLMLEAFDFELKSIPSFRRTSNGFAVHFCEATARANALREATERHLLQLTFFKHGWDGFRIIAVHRINDLTIQFATSCYSLNGFRAGIVIARGSRFPGVSFGYLAAPVDGFEKSARWQHAIHEAVDKIDPYLNLKSLDELTSIERAIHDWMMNPVEIELRDSDDTIVQLPTIADDLISSSTFDLQKRWNLEFPLFAAFSQSRKLLPLLIPSRISSEDHLAVAQLLKGFDLPEALPKKNPIL